MIKITIRFSLLVLMLAAVACAQEDFGSLFSRVDNDREEFLSGGGIRVTDLGTFTSDPATNIFVQNGKVRPGQTNAYRASFTEDVSEAIIGVEFWDYIDENGGDVLLEVNMDSRRKPFLRGNVNTDTQCRERKVEEEAVVCSFDTSSKGEGTLYFWVTGKEFTTYNIYVVQRKD